MNHRATRRHGTLDVNTLALLAILLAAGFILNLTVGKALSATGIQPEFVIAAFCLTILLARPGVAQALVIGLVSAAVIQITTSTPGVDFIAEGVSAMLMALLARLPMRIGRRNIAPLVASFVTTFVSGSIFAVVATVIRGGVIESSLVMLPVVATTAVANALIVQALYVPLRRIVPAETSIARPAPTAGGRRPGPNPVENGPIIDIEGLSFSYGNSPDRALDGVSLAVEAGELLGVIGPSGAGKSTLAATLSGAIPHHFAGSMAGSVRIAGMDTAACTLTDVSRTVGSVLQDIDAQMVAAEVEDEILYGLENFGVPRGQIPARIEGALAAVGIEDLRHREIATLSGGQKQKVAIAAILALEPRILVLDEPTAALDPASSRSVFETLARVNREMDVTVVVIEQNVALLSAYCSRIAVMEHGRVVLDGASREVFAHGSELRRIGVDSPRVARVCNSLAERGLAAPGRPCLTVDETVELVGGIVRAGRPARPEDREGSADARPEQPGASAGAAMARKARVAADTAVARETDLATGTQTADGMPAQAASPRTQPVLRLEEASFAYSDGGGCVEGISFDVRAGELVSIVGANGAGKTTLTKLLNGIFKPSTGSVRIVGLDTRTARTSEISAHAATLFQNPDRQICQNSVQDEVAFGPILHGADPGSAHERARIVVDRLGLPAEAAPFSLSRGQRQLVALASVIVADPEVLVLDEPTSGLDYRECMTVMQAVEELRANGCAIVMVCHDMEVVSDFATRLIVMARGRVLADGDPHELFSNAQLMAAASIEPPQAMRLTGRLAEHVDPAFARLVEVADIVELTGRLAGAPAR